MRWSLSGAVLVLLASAVGAAGCTREEASDPGSTQASPSPTALPVLSDGEPAPTESAGVVAKLPDHIRYGPGGVVVVRSSVETVVVDDPVEWAGSDGVGGVVYSVEDQVWWQPEGNGDALPIDAEGWFARAVDGRPVLIARTGEAGCGEGDSNWLALHDLASGEEQRFTCDGGSGDATWHVGDVGDGRYVGEWGTDLANYSTMGGLIIGEVGATDPQPSSGLDLPGNPYPDAQSCRVLRDGEPEAACEVHGLLSPDGLLLATWYRPDYSIVVPPMEAMPLEVIADEPAWVARLDMVPAEVRVTELDTGIERYRTELAARSRIADFDGRFLVTSPRCPVATTETCDDGSETWTIIDTSGQQPPLTLPGPLALLRPQGTDGPWVEVDAPQLERGDTGPWVSFLQQRLQSIEASIAADGTFGPATESAVRDLQTVNELTVDGVVGPKTWTTLSTAEPSVDARPDTPATTNTVAPAPTAPATGQPEDLAVLRPGGLGPVDFGTPAEDAVEAISTLLGPPNEVATILPIGSGEDGCVEGADWLDCLRGLRVREQGRLLRWTSLGLDVAIVDTDRSGGPAPLQFGDWHATPATGGASPTTAEGLHAGMSVGELRGVYPSVGFGYNEGLLDGYSVDASGSGQYWGRLDPNPATAGYDFDGLIRAVQAALNERGAHLAVDGEWGPRAEAAWEEFLTSNNLPVFTVQLWMTPDVGDALGLPPDDWTVATIEPRPA